MIHASHSLELHKILCSFAGQLKSAVIMASIVLKYNPHNPIAQKAIEFILSLGIFEKEEKISSSPFAESDNDIKKGRVYSAINADELIKQCLK